MTFLRKILSYNEHMSYHSKMTSTIIKIIISSLPENLHEWLAF